MPIYIGDKEIATVFKGDTELDNIRLGDQQQWIGIIVTPDPSITYISRNTSSLTFDLTNNHEETVTIFYEIGDNTPDQNSVVVAANATQRVTLSGLSFNTTYTLFAYALEAEQLPSNTISNTQTTQDVTENPSILSINPDINSVTFSLRNNDNVTATIYYEVNDSTPDLTVSVGAGQTVSRTISGLNPDQNYTIYARALASGKATSSTVNTGFTTDSAAAQFIYTGDAYGGLNKFDSNFSPIFTNKDVTPFGGSIHDLQVHPDHYLVMSDHRGYGHKIDSNGNIIWSSADYGSDAYSIAVHQNGNIYMSTDTDIRKLNSNGGFVWIYSGPTELGGITNVEGLKIDANENVYATSAAGRTFSINSSGSNRWAVNTAGGSRMHIALASNGDIFVAGGFADRVHKVTSSGSLVWSNTTPTDTVWDVTTTSSNDAIAGDNDGKVYKFRNSDGAVLVTKSNHNSGLMGFTSDLADNIYTIGQGNRLKLFDANLSLQKNVTQSSFIGSSISGIATFPVKLYGH